MKCYMKDLGIRRWTGIIGIGISLLTMIELRLYFVYDGPPPVSNILTRILVDLLLCLGYLAFIVGLRQLILDASPDHEWVGRLCYTSGLVYVTLTLVADSIQVGSVLGSHGEIDPTTIGAGGEGALLVFGPIGRLLMALFLITAGAAILGTDLLPKWTAWVALTVAVFQLALVPSIFSGTDPSHFYSINGWGVAVAGALFMLWILTVSIVMLRRKDGSLDQRISQNWDAASEQK
ncbi:MAG TPA: hypothetical protein VJ302_04295 [Blastocatellia bacterium]|nr:hypothetical protein [Blastocatellia bacterium]